MAMGKVASWAFAEEFVDEAALFENPGVLARARERGSELGLVPVLAGAAAHVRATAALLGARSIIEVGTGSGVLGLYILSALGSDATLTSIDPEPENIRIARAAFSDAGIASSRVRTINSAPEDVLMRLTEAAYDLVVVPAHERLVEQLVERALRLVRPGGALVLVNALFHDQVPQVAASQGQARIVRTVIDELAADSSLVCSLSTAGDGVLTAVKKQL